MTPSTRSDHWHANDKAAADVMAHPVRIDEVTSMIRRIARKLVLLLTP